MRRHCDAVICSLLLCEWLLYCSSIVSSIELYVTQYYMSGYYVFHVSCSPILGEWLLYCSCVVTIEQSYVAHCYVFGFYIVHVLLHVV